MRNLLLELHNGEKTLDAERDADARHVVALLLLLALHKHADEFVVAAAGGNRADRPAFLELGVRQRAAVRGLRRRFGDKREFLKKRRCAAQIIATNLS